MSSDNRGTKPTPPPLSPMWSKTIFPDARGVFTAAQRSTDEIKSTCLVVLDANVLLLPYKMEGVSLSEIVKVYQPLVKAGRLVIPPQAVREFAKNRSEKVGDMVKYLREQASLSGPVLSKKIGALEGHEGYKAAKALAESIKESIRDLQKSISAVADDITGNVGDDPVSQAYRSLFADAVCADPAECDDEAALSKELQERYAMSRPPGYKDQTKDDGGAGDLIIWKTILAEGARRQLDCIFVTADQKPDWYVQAGGPFQPRFELLDEYRCTAGGTLHILPLSRLLSIFEASEAIVDVVRDAETRTITDNHSDYYYKQHLRSREMRLLEVDLRTTEASILELEGRLKTLPPYDGNLALPWNKVARQIQAQLGSLHSRRDDIRNEMQILSPDVAID